MAPNLSLQGPTCTQNYPKMEPRRSKVEPRRPQRTQIPNCFEMGFEMTQKLDHLGVHVGVLFCYVFLCFFAGLSDIRKENR